MAKVDLKIKSETTRGESQTTTISYVNPALTNSQLSTLAHTLNALTNNTYDGSQKITTVNVDSEAGGGQAKPTFTVTDGSGNTIADGSTVNTTRSTNYEVNFNYDGDATDIFISTSPEDANFRYWRRIMSGTGQPAFGLGFNPAAAGTYTVKVLVPETDNYIAAEFTFDITAS